MLNKYITVHKEFKANDIGTDYFVGDLHGEYEQLMYLLKTVKFDFDIDRLFCTGDLINRGPESAKCLKLLAQPWFNAVKGNHEELLISIIEKPVLLEALMKAGGQWINQEPDIILHHLIALVHAKMALSFTVKTAQGTIGVIHAQAPEHWQSLTNQTLTKHEQDECIWSLEKSSQDTPAIDGVDVTVHGHINGTSITVSKNQIWIDTIKKTGALTLVNAEQLFALTEVTNEHR